MKKFKKTLEQTIEKLCEKRNYLAKFMETGEN